MTEITFDIDQHLLEVVPHPRPASKFVPDWYKNMEQEFTETGRVSECGAMLERQFPSLKKCFPVRDYLTAGYIIPAWMEHRIKKDSKGKMHNVAELSGHFEGYEVGCDWHGRVQVKGSPLEGFTDGDKILKINSPWRVTTPKGYSCLFFSPFYQTSQFTILPAIVDTDNHSVPINFPTIVSGDEAILEKGQPLVQVIPFKREDWSHKIIPSDKRQKHIQHLRFGTMWGSFYTKFLWHRKRFR